MQRLAAIALALVLLALASASVAQDGPVRLATLDWPPYIATDLPRQGYVAEVAREAFARAGVEVELNFLPWKRTLEETRSGKFHAYLPEYFDYRRMRDFVFSTPFPGGPLALMVRADSRLEYKTLHDLEGVRIGVVRGYVNTRAFDSADFLTKEEFVDDETCLRMLLSGRVDAVVADVNVANYIVGQRLGRVGVVRPLAPALGDRLLYVCFPKSRPDHMERLTQFNTGLSAMRCDGSLARLAAHYGLAPAIH